MMAAACGRNLVPVKLELGGKGAAVVFDDVDLPQTVEKLAQAITFHAGQVCCDATRWLVHGSIYKQFVGRASSGCGGCEIGYQLDADTQIGPVVSEKQRDRVLGYLRRGREEGAERCWRAAGRSAGPGRLLRQAGAAGRLARQRGGPRGDFRPRGLPGAVCRRGRGRPPGQPDRLRPGQQRLDRRPGRANRVAEAMMAGNNWINTHNVFAQGMPYAGVNKSGLGGGVLSVETLFDYWRNLSVVRPL